MNKTDALMWLMRAHEAIRKLPDGADINGVDITLYNIDGNKISLYMNKPVKLNNIVTKTEKRYKDDTKGTPSRYGRVEVSDSNGIDYWWGCKFDD